MTIKTFRAHSVSDALAQIKKELGAGAVILHTRTYKVGGVLGVGAKSITEITATADMAVTSRLTARQPAPPRAAPAPPARAPARPAPVAAPVVTASPPQSSPAPTPRRPEIVHGTDHATLTPALASPPGVTAQLRDEMAMLRRMVARLVESGPRAAPVSTDALQACYLRLLESEVASELADSIVSSVRGELTPAQQSQPDAVRAAVLRRLTAYIPAADHAPAPERDPSRPATLALIGPTGVGKTTTIAKLAATYKLRQGKRVGLITADTYRIAAVDQLRTYAGIIGLPLKVALTPAEMSRACEALQDCDVILIDTPGRAPADAGKLADLGSFLDAAGPHQVHLVLSSAASQACMKQAVRSFAPLGPSHVIFTKLDEAVNFGVLVNTARDINARLSFVTTGQEVPDHILPGDPARIASLILDGVPAGGL